MNIRWAVVLLILSVSCKARIQDTAKTESITKSSSSLSKIGDNVRKCLTRPIPQDTYAKLRLKWSSIQGKALQSFESFKRLHQQSNGKPLDAKLHEFQEARMSPSTTISADHPGADALATNNWYNAENLAYQWAISARPLTLDFMNSINIAINAGETGLVGTPGKIRTYDLYPIGHPLREYPKGGDVMVMMQDFITWYHTESRKPGVSSIELAAESYQQLVSIHPYPDGNGRTTRLIMDAILLRHSFPPGIFNGEKMVKIPGGFTYQINDFDVACYGLLDDKANIPPGFSETSLTEAIDTAIEMLQKGS